MNLTRIKFAFDFVVVVVEHLQLAHADVGRVSLTGISNSESIVSAGRNLEVQADDEIAVFRFGEDRATLARFAGDGSLRDFVVVDGAFPAGEVLAVEDADKTVLLLFVRQFSRHESADRGDQR